MRFEQEQSRHRADLGGAAAADEADPAEIADPTGTELRSFSPKDIADIVAVLIP